ncbi:hypothetical protein D8Y22_05835 [Salinadaptatus halalkaliphilus]|uniref:Uncharacterized protein n=1 Tax=Salinadaptatus halalkaliphilus TaxID=2419781 RepID=A0A4S3TN61_9EURY|nr:hypothetical protein [Salinadaptatus halalkaliphilus]THE65692.1 hypothetical protein D8Y22_05835 [Salinadaptatus halalkaliphilus]
MSLERVFDRLSDPGSHSFPDYGLPRGDPVMPIAVTREELSTVLALYETFQAVDPTGLEANPLLAATRDYMERTFGVPHYRPDEQLADDIETMLTTVSNELGSRSMGVVDATPAHHRTLYFFLVNCRGYHVAPHVRFDPDPAAVETLYDFYQRVTEQDVYLKNPASVLE